MADRQFALAHPWPVRGAIYLLLLVALSHVMVPAPMWLWHDRLTAEIAAQHPDLAAGTLASSTTTALYSAAIFHGVLLAICGLAVMGLARGARWARRLAIVSQLVSIAFSIVSWRASTMFHPLIPVVDMIQALIVALLLAARPTRPSA